MLHLHSPIDWKCLNVLFVRHAESTNNCLFDEIRKTFNENIDETIVCATAILKQFRKLILMFILYF